MKTLKEGEIDVTYSQCKVRSELSARLKDNPPDLVIADFDVSENLREIIEQEMEASQAEIPMIFLVKDMMKLRDHDILRRGLWDFVCKDQLFKLIPSVYSSQRYIKLFNQTREADRALSESRDRYMSIFKSVDDAIVLFDYKTRKIAEYNPSFLELFELSEEEVPHINLEDFNAEDEGFTLERGREHVPKLNDGEPVSGLNGKISPKAGGNSGP